MDNKNTTLSKEELAIQKKKAKEAKRAEIAKTLPKYTRGEEIFNAVSHIVGGSLGIGALVVGIVFAALKTDKIGVISMIIFGLSIMILYTMSAIYHFLFINKAKKVFRVFDHCTIYLLIAGTYTPICLITLRNEWIWGYLILGIVWFLAILGIVFNAIMLDKKPVKIMSQILYIIMGWGIVAAIKLLVKNMALPGVILIIAGGVCYTVGVIFYALGKKVKYFHSIWHLFDLFGTILQYMGILLYAVIGI